MAEETNAVQDVAQRSPLIAPGLEDLLHAIIKRAGAGEPIVLTEEADAVRLAALCEIQFAGPVSDSVGTAVRGFTEEFLKEITPITGREQVRRALSAINECNTPITAALREAPYHLARPAFDILDNITDTVAAELGVVVAARCDHCEELIFEDEPWHPGEDVTLCALCMKPAHEAAAPAVYRPDDRYVQLARDLVDDHGMLMAFTNVHLAHPNGFTPSDGDEFRYTRLAQASWDNVAEFVAPKVGGAAAYYLTIAGSELGLALKWLEQNPDEVEAPSAIIEPSATVKAAADDETFPF